VGLDIVLEESWQMAGYPPPPPSGGLLGHQCQRAILDSTSTGVQQSDAHLLAPASLIEQIGLVGIDLGSLIVGGKLARFPSVPLPNQNLIKVS
jgi:hypothetical protein